MADRVKDAKIPGFAYERIAVDDASYLVAVGGDGPPVVLLHGYPQTHYCWREVGPELARTHRVIAPDIRGYGATRAPAGGPRGEGYSKREMAAETVSLLDELGVDRAAVVGHDRGGRVAYRMALDHPARVERLAVLNIVPTVDQFERVTPDNAIGYWPWFFLAQPAPFPERLIAAAPDHYLRSIVDAWASRPERIGQAAVGHYVAALDDATIAATCADYRASFHLDRRLDAADRAAGRRIEQPLLVLWGALDEGLSDDAGPLDVWRRWAERLEGVPIPAGHFIPEEAPEELLAALAPFLEPLDQPP
jgi:haloacetate dehalogenase